MNNKKSKNIWEINGIPELDYCGIERAVELLGCKISDLLCLAENRRIEICIKLRDFESSMVAPIELRSKKEWESFVSRNFSLFMTGDVATSKNGLSIFSPKMTHSFMIEEKKGKTEIKCFYDNDETIMTDFSHCSPIAYLYGLWSVTFMGRKPFDDLLNNKEINLTSLDFLLTEADYQTDTSTMEQFVFSPLSYYLYENGLLDKSKLKPITTLTINDLYITKKQLNRIFDNKGKTLPRIMPTEDESKHIKENNTHPTQKKALENRMEIKKAINKLLAIYPSNPKDKDMCYRTKDGKLIKGKIADVLNLHEATLFDSGELPLRDRETLLAAISEYLKELGWNSNH